MSSTTASADAPNMTHRQIMEALSGLLLAMFVAILSSTVVSAALPRIIGDLGGGQSSYTWVVTATLLAMTVSTPIWGKLADLFDRKTLLQTGLVIFLTGSILAGFAHSSGWLITCRAVQGVGVGALTALVQVILADLVSARERGRYMGYLGAVFGVGTVVGPVIGGLLTDGLGWRWCFFVGVPFGLAALVLLQRTLHLPTRRREGVHIDVLGATLLAGGVSLLLIWVSLAGKNFAWWGPETIAMIGGAVVLLVALIAVERRVAEPMLPMELFANRTVSLAVVGSVAIGIAMFGTTVFLTQYMQLARGYSPTASGLLTIPMVAGLFVSSTLAGRRIAKTGHYRQLMLAGAVLVTAGLGLMALIDEHTSLVEVGLFMVVLGAGIGMLQQNMILAVQNAIPPSQLGAGSGLIAFFRSLGGAAGVSVLGAVLGSKVTSLIGEGLTARGIDPSAIPGGGSQIPNLDTLPAAVRPVIEHAYGAGVAELFLLALPLGVVVFLAIWFMREETLGTKSGIEQALEDAAGEEARVPATRLTAATVGGDG
ncbi:MAG: MDR family MFS transporter [Solirubrobacteraceae bacterium]